MCCCVFGTEIAKLQDLAELTIHTARDLYNERRTKGRMRRDRVWSDFCAEGPQCKLRELDVLERKRDADDCHETCACPHEVMHGQEHTKRQPENVWQGQVGRHRHVGDALAEGQHHEARNLEAAETIGNADDGHAAYQSRY